MKLTRRILSVLLVGLCTSAFSSSGGNENDFAEALFDVRAFVEASEFSYNDFSPKAIQVSIALNRYTRHGGNNLHLIAAAENYIKVKKNWDIELELKPKVRNPISRETLAIDVKALIEAGEAKALAFENANTNLNTYSEMKKSQKPAVKKKIGTQ